MAITKILTPRADWPDVPNGREEIEAMFGKFRWRDPIPGERIHKGFVLVEPEWKGDHLVTATLPIVGKMTIHKKIEPIIISVLNQIMDRGSAHLLKLMLCYCARHKMCNPRRELSTHSWGIAFDVNPNQNRVGTDGSMPQVIIDAFKEHNFEWGGDWRFRDPMHFQYATGY